MIIVSFCYGYVIIGITVSYVFAVSKHNLSLLLSNKLLNVIRNNEGIRLKND